MPMASPTDLVAILRRLAPRLEAMFRRFGVAPSEAAEILDEAVLEVQLRAARTPDCEGRLLRAVERGCRERLVERRRRALEALEEARLRALESTGTDDDAGR
jgi:hypothetical protein